MKNQKNNKKICLVYDDLFQKGGGEKFFLYLISIFPTASIYVPIVSKYYLEILKKREIKYSKSLSQLSKFPKIGYPLASILSLFYFEKLKLNNFDVVVSLSNRFAHCVITSSTAAHLAIVTTPFRALYSSNKSYLISNIFTYFRVYLQASFKRPDKIIAISTVSQKRLRKFLSIESTVLNPPLLLTAEVKKFSHPSIQFENEDYILLVGRIVDSKLKYFDEVLRDLGALGKINTKIVFVGEGQKLNYLKRKYKNVIFTGYLEQSKLNYLYKNAKVLIHPQVEDYGLIPLEAIYFNTPIICKKEGGVLDYLTKNSVLFYNTQKEFLINLRLVLDNKYQLDTEKYSKILEIAKPTNFEYNLKNIIKNI